MRWTLLLLFIFLIILLGIASFIFYDVILQNPGQFNILPNNNQEQNTPIFNQEILDEYPEGITFHPNMRFRSKQISYSVDPTCPENRKNDTHQAFEILTKETILSFNEVENKGEITAICSEQIKELPEDYFVAGEGGPSHVVNTTKYFVIFNGTILLYKDNKCKKPIVAIHEILHTISFAHSSNKDSIMYNFSDCNQKITPLIVNTIEQLYKDPTLPDLVFKEVIATKSGRYLDINFTVANQGLKNSDKVNITLFNPKKETEINSYEFEDFKIGTGKIIKIENLRVSSSLENLKLVIDNENQIIEIDENNNIIEMALSS